MFDSVLVVHHATSIFLHFVGPLRTGCMSENKALVLRLMLRRLELTLDSSRSQPCGAARFLHGNNGQDQKSDKHLKNNDDTHAGGLVANVICAFGCWVLWLATFFSAFSELLSSSAIC